MAISLFGVIPGARLRAEQSPAPAAFDWVRQGVAAAIIVDEGENAAVGMAARDLRRDVATVTGIPPDRAPADARIVILSRENRNLAAALRRWAVDESLMPTGRESFRILSREKNQLVVLGADDLGAIYGIYYLSQRYLGVDPLILWGTLPPPHRDAVSLPATDYLEPSPRFKWRGWFINDEDLLTGWHESDERRDLVHYYFNHPITPEVYQRVFETALRLRCNLIIPGSYIDLESAADKGIVGAVVARGLYVSQHHTQPLGVSAFAFHNYWLKRHRDMAFSYATNPEAFREVWTHYAELWKRYGGDKVIWQLGLRGTGDRSFWSDDPMAPKDDAGRGRMISQAVDQEWNIISRGAKTPPVCTTTFWAEGAALNEKGLVQLPPGVICVFADDGPTQEMCEDFYHTPRQAGRQYGAYTHAAFWGAGPHLVQGASLSRLAKNMQLLLANQASTYHIQNVSNIREFLLPIEAAAQWSSSSGPIDADQFLLDWCARIYGSAAASRCADIYRQIPEAYPPHPYLKVPSRRYLDGDIRAEGKRLISAALDRDFFSSSVQTGTVPSGVEAALATVSSRFGDLLRDGNALAAALPADRRTFFQDNVIVQLELQKGMADWASGVCQAIRQFGAARVAVAASDMDKASEALAGCLDQRKAAEHGVWRDWYHGDWRMNLPALLNDSWALAQRFHVLASGNYDLEWCGTGPRPVGRAAR